MINGDMYRTLLVALALGAATSDAEGIKGLAASSPAPDLAARMNLFGQFVGDWECDTTLIDRNGCRITGTCEWHFGWVLEGKAIQDVWIARYGHVQPGSPADAYGTTLRYFDPKQEVWRVIWISALSNSVQTFTAKQVGEEIVLEGRNEQGSRYRWIFFEITPRSFHWRSVGSPDDGKTWILGQEMSVRRVDSDRKAIEELEREWLAAETDPAALDRILSSDFLHPVPSGLALTKQQHIDWAVKHPGPPDRKSRIEQLNIRLYGDVAIANGIVDDDSHRTIFTDVFAYRNGRWQAVNAQENAVIH
jgi:hypothetical protein